LRFSKLFQVFLQASSLIKDYHSCFFRQGQQCRYSNSSSVDHCFCAEAAAKQQCSLGNSSSIADFCFSRLCQGFLQASSLIKDYHSCFFAKGSSADITTAAV
jgi:hypothetical protein